MTTDEFVPDQLFGRGCDLARIRNRTAAFLYERKRCEWNRKKAREALDQLKNTIDDLRTKGCVEPNCSFSRFVIRVKDSPHCSTDGAATAMVEAEGARYLAGSTEEGRKAVAAMESLGAK